MGSLDFLGRGGGFSDMQKIEFLEQEALEITLTVLNYTVFYSYSIALWSIRDKY